MTELLSSNVGHYVILLLAIILLLIVIFIWYLAKIVRSSQKDGKKHQAYDHTD